MIYTKRVRPEKTRKRLCNKKFSCTSSWQNKTVPIYRKMRHISSTLFFFSVKCKILIPVLGNCNRAVWVRCLMALTEQAHVNPSSPTHVSFYYGFPQDCMKRAARVIKWKENITHLALHTSVFIMVFSRTAWRELRGSWDEQTGSSV